MIEKSEETIEEEIPEEPQIRLEISPVLGNILQNMNIPMDLVPHASCFQVVPFEEDGVDGKPGEKSIAIALAISVGNGLQVVWFRANDLQVFIQNAMQAHQKQLALLQQLHPLQIADTNTMNHLVQQKNFADGKLLLGGR